MKRLIQAIVAIVLLYLLAVALTSYGYLGQHGTTKTTTEMHWQESPGGASGTVRDSQRR